MKRRAYVRAFHVNYSEWYKLYFFWKYMCECSVWLVDLALHATAPTTTTTRNASKSTENSSFFPNPVFH